MLDFEGLESQLIILLILINISKQMRLFYSLTLIIIIGIKEIAT